MGFLTVQKKGKKKLATLLIEIRKRFDVLSILVDFTQLKGGGGGTSEEDVTINYLAMYIHFKRSFDNCCNKQCN